MILQQSSTCLWRWLWCCFLFVQDVYRASLEDVSEVTKETDAKTNGTW